MSDENDDKQIIETDGVDETAGADLQTSSEEDEQPTQLGAARYVFAAFFAGGLLIAYLAGMMPWLLQVAEDERTNYTLPFGAIIGIIVIIWAYRKQRVRVFADEVASELTKVTWPTKDMVTTGTITVIIGVVIAAIYIGLLDQVWNFLTNLVYGA